MKHKLMRFHSSNMFGRVLNYACERVSFYDNQCALLLDKAEANRNAGKLQEEYWQMPIGSIWGDFCFLFKGAR